MRAWWLCCWVWWFCWWCGRSSQSQCNLNINCWRYRGKCIVCRSDNTICGYNPIPPKPIRLHLGLNWFCPIWRLRPLIRQRLPNGETERVGIGSCMYLCNIMSIQSASKRWLTHILKMESCINTTTCFIHPWNPGNTWTQKNIPYWTMVAGNTKALCLHRFYSNAEPENPCGWRLVN